MNSIADAIYFISMNDLEERVKAIEERNRNVESDKAWETSLTRMLMIGVMTYAIAAFVLWILQSDQFLLNALVPAIGFVLSMQSLPFIKEWWIKTYRR